MADRSPLRVEPERVTGAIWLGTVLVGLGCAGVAVLAVALFGGGTRLAGVARVTALLGLGLGLVASFVVLRIDLWPTVRRLAGAALRDREEASEQVGALGARLLSYPRRLSRLMAVLLLVLLPAGALVASWLAGDVRRWFLPLLPATLLAVPLAAAAAQFTTRRVLRRVQAGLPPPRSAAAFGGSLAALLRDTFTLPAALAALVGVLFVVLDAERSTERAWRESHERAVLALAAAPRGVPAGLPDDEADVGGPTAGFVPSCAAARAPLAVAACRAAGAAAGRAGSWIDASGGVACAAAPASLAPGGARGAAVLCSPLPAPAGTPAWALAALFGLLAAAWLAGTLLGRSLGAGLRPIAETVLHTGRDARERPSAPPAPPRHRVVELDRLGATAAATAGRTAEMRRDQTTALEALDEAQRMRTQFLASVSHDLKGPLNAILGFSELLLRGVEGPLASKQREDVRLVHHAGEDLLGIINGILDSAKLEAGRIELHQEWTPSVELISEAVRQARAVIGERDITVQTQLQAGLPPVLVDPHRIGQALQALVSNAVKFTDFGVITVRAFIERDAEGRRTLRVDVRDPGRGIADEDQSRIFRVFEQVDRSSNRSHGGPGLGLFIARSMIELHDGRLWFSSQIGKGSTFSFALPLPEETEPGPSSSRKSVPPSAPRA